MCAVNPGRRTGGARQRIGDYFKKHVGEIVDVHDVDKMSGISSGPRRIRELRAMGWDIRTHHDDDDLKPGQYRLAALPASDNGDNYKFSQGISARLRAEVLERNGYTCQMCGIGAGEINTEGRKTRLHVGHILDKSHGGENKLGNLRALCSTCNEGAKNLVQEPPSYTWLLSQVRRAKAGDQKEVLKWLKSKFKDE